jgi:hypothetical protein
MITPPQLPAVIAKEKEAYQYWLALYKNFPKIERFGLGKKLDNIFLNILELTFTASYLKIDQKIIFLAKTIQRLDVLKFFVQLSWENNFIPSEKFTEFSQKLDEVGRQLGAWKKGLLKK